MAYATVGDLLGVLTEKDQIELTDDNYNDGETANQEIIDSALSAASSRVDSYISKRFTTPLSTPPASITDATLTLAKIRLYNRRSIPLTETMQKEYDGVIRWLERIARGEIDLPEVAEGESDDVAAFGVGSTEQMFFNRMPF